MADLYRYASLSDVPLTGPDPYSDAEKDRAIGAANARLEADVNEGEVIEAAEEIHTHAVAAYATYVLSVGPKAPDSATLGDTADEGPRRMAFAEQLRQIYQECIESITMAEGDEGSKPAIGVWKTYSSGDS